MRVSFRLGGWGGLPEISLFQLASHGQFLKSESSRKEFSMLKNKWLVSSLALTLCAFFSLSAMAQETTGGLQGTVKDPSGAVVPNAKVVVTGTSLVGSKELETDSSGYYRFANLPPGNYTITVTAKGFKTFKRAGLTLEVGHLPTSDVVLEVGTAETIVEVSAAAPVIDTTTTQNLTNVPFQFIQEVEVKTSGIEAEHGGALGGVINVIMKKGSNAYHGELFATYEPSGVDANPTNAFLRYDPLDQGNSLTGLDPAAQLYQAQKDHFRILQPGFSVGGPIAKDRLFFFLGFAPQVNSLAKTVNFGSKQGNAGSQYFTQDRQTYYGTA